MKLEPLGEAAFVIRDLGTWDPADLCEALGSAGIPGVHESVCAYETAAIYVDPDSFEIEPLVAWLESGPQIVPTEARRTHRIPVCYSLGEDLASVCESKSLDVQEFVALHCSQPYRCYAVGFAPGFPYLGMLPPKLSGVPRLATPRVRVPAGSVGITGSQTGIYPRESPGGWSLIGRTPLCLVDVAVGYFPIRAGDVVEFEPIDEVLFGELEGQRL